MTTTIKPFSENAITMEFADDIKNIANVIVIKNKKEEVLFNIDIKGNVKYMVDGKEKTCTTDKELSKSFGAALIVMSKLYEENHKLIEQQ